MVRRRALIAAALVIASTANALECWVEAEQLHCQSGDQSSARPLSRVEWRSWLVLDASSQRVYWTEHGWGLPGRIQSSKIDGSDVHDFVGQSAGTPCGLALDESSGFLYWIDAGHFSRRAGAIKRARIDDAIVEEIATIEALGPRDLVLDSEAGYLYWSEQLGSRIYRIRTNGKDLEEIAPFETEKPAGLALDTSRHLLYWIDQLDGHIVRYDLRSKATTTIATIPVKYRPCELGDPGLYAVQRFCDLELGPDGNSLFWTDFGTGEIGKYDLRSGEVTRHRAGVRPTGLVYDPRSQGFFVADVWTRRIQHFSATDGRLTSIASISGIVPIGLVATTKKYYWAFHGGLILRANLDGTGVERVSSLTATTSPPAGHGLGTDVHLSK